MCPPPSPIHIMTAPLWFEAGKRTISAVMIVRREMSGNVGTCRICRPSLWGGGTSINTGR